MTMKRHRLVPIVLVASLLVLSIDSHCSINHSTNPECVELFELLQTSLLETKFDLFQLQSIFIPSSHHEPILVNVSFSLSDTATAGSTLCSNCTPSNPCLYAWTKRSLYQYFHPAVVNQLQFRLPFTLMRLMKQSPSDDEPDLDAYLWDGLPNSLPSVKLNLTVNSRNLSSNIQQYFQNCTPQAADTVHSALKEVTKWLGAYAKVQPKPTLVSKLVNLDVMFKAYALPESAIKPYSHLYLPESEMGALQFMCVIGFIAFLLLVPVFVIFLNKSIHEMNNRSKSVIAGGTIVTSMFNMMSILAELYDLNRSVTENNWFAVTKLIFMLTIFTWSIVCTSLQSIYTCTHNINFINRFSLFVFIAVASITCFGSHLGLFIFPTVIYLFIHPLNTMSLLFLHISVVYCITVLLGIFIYYVHQWVSTTGDKNSIGEKCHKFLICLFFLLYLCFMWTSVIIGYITVIEFYQLVINRNVYDQFVWASLTDNIPTLIMFYITWMLNRQFLDERENRLEQKD